MSSDRTDAQKAAARINGSKSHGPVTPAGKRISPLNARKHGLYANTLVLPDENRDSFLRLCADLTLYFHPHDTLEEILVHRMIAAQWRANRCQQLESAGLTVEISRLGAHKEHTLDGNVVHVPAARTKDAFVELHGQGQRGSLIELSEMRQKREFDRAYLQLMNKREREGALHPLGGAKMDLAGIEPGQLIDSEQNSPPENPGPQPASTRLQPDSPALEPESVPQPEPVPLPEAA